MESFNQVLLERLTASGPRLPWIKKWLIEEVWNSKNYNALTHVQYLTQGEASVNNFETLISASAYRVYDELLSSSDPDKQFLNILSDKETAIVLFDGLSLREIPIIKRLSENSGFKVKEVDCSLAAVPCDTAVFIQREFGFSSAGPSQLSGRKELKSKGITVVYTNDITQRINTDNGGNSLLIWSTFPDNTYKDSGAKFENHFENIHVRFETAWMHSVQQIKNKKRLIITSDHGYIFFGTGMDFPRSSQEMRELNDYFGNDRYAFLTEKPTPPQSDDIIVDERRQVAIIKGRVKTRSTGEAATKLYKHGGLSLMEMLTPWVVLET